MYRGVRRGGPEVFQGLQRVTEALQETSGVLKGVSADFRDVPTSNSMCFKGSDVHMSCRGVLRHFRVFLVQIGSKRVQECYRGIFGVSTDFRSALIVFRGCWTFQGLNGISADCYRRLRGFQGRFSNFQERSRKFQVDVRAGAHSTGGGV